MTNEVTFIGLSGSIWTYWPDQLLGEPGGFGRVYAGKGHDGRQVAVKVVAKNSFGETIDARLLRREIEIGRRVAESGSSMLLPVIDAAETESALLLVISRAERSLATMTTPMPELDVISVMIDIATGVQDLHSTGIIHRDLKPGNVLWHDLRWKLADFGIARDQEIGTQNPTFIGAGSHPYMAPEIWEMQSPTVKTDLYALGCIAFELLTGYPPYPGNREIARYGHLRQPPPDVPAANSILKVLITRLIAKDPGERSQDARAVLERLARATRKSSDDQEAIALSLARDAQDRGHVGAQTAVEREAADQRRRQATQAKAELSEIISDAALELQGVVPEADFYSSTASIAVPSGIVVGFGTLATPEAELVIYIEDAAPGVSPGDNAIVLVGATFITNHWFPAKEDGSRQLGWEPASRDPDGLLSANITYGPMGNRLGWQVYRFRGSQYGPSKYLHGIDCEIFRAQASSNFSESRQNSHHEVASITPLTAGELLALFREAIDIRPPEPRPGGLDTWNE